jgi:hypothetical protein
MSELEDFDYLDDDTKTILTNVFNSWLRCKNKHLFIENVNNSIIKIGRVLEINGKKYEKEHIPKNATIFISNCNNSNIKITDKFNHLIILKCDNTNVYISHGLISGIDIIRSNNITCDVKFSKIYYLACCYSDTFTLHIDENIANNMMLTTSNSYKVIFKLHTGLETKEYITNMSLFPELTYYSINKNVANVMMIYYANRYGNGEL